MSELSFDKTDLRSLKLGDSISSLRTVTVESEDSLGWNEVGDESFLFTISLSFSIFRVYASLTLLSI